MTRCKLSSSRQKEVEKLREGPLCNEGMWRWVEDLMTQKAIVELQAF